MPINTHSGREKDNPLGPIANARIRSSFLPLNLKAIRDGCEGRKESRMAFSVVRCASRGRGVTRPGGVADLGLGVSSETQRGGRSVTMETKRLGRQRCGRWRRSPETQGTAGAGAGVAGDTAGDLNIRLCHTRGAADNFITSAYKNDCRGMQMARASRPPAPRSAAGCGPGAATAPG